MHAAAAAAGLRRLPRRPAGGPFPACKTCCRLPEYSNSVSTYACRRRLVRHGVRSVAGRRQQAAGGAPRRAAGAAARRQPGPHRGGVHAALRRAVPAQGGAGARRRLPPPHRQLGHSCRALLLLDGWLPPLGAPQGTTTAAMASVRAELSRRRSRTDPFFLGHANMPCRS